MLRQRRWLAVLAIALLSAACASKTSSGDSPTPTGTIFASEAGGSATPSPSPSPSGGTTRWRATMRTHSEFHIEHPSALICITEYKFVLDFQASANGVVKGSGVADLTDVPACPRQYNVVIVERIRFDVSGKLTSDGFAITVTPTGSLAPYGSLDLTGMLISLSGDETSGDFTLKVPFSDASHTLAHDEFPRKTTAGSGIYTTESAVVIVPAD